MMEPKNPERGVQLQDRDWELLIGLFESRTMLRKHLLDLYFSDVRDYGEKRIPRLTKGGYIGSANTHKSVDSIHPRFATSRARDCAHLRRNLSSSQRTGFRGKCLKNASVVRKVPSPTSLKLSISRSR